MGPSSVVEPLDGQSPYLEDSRLAQAAHVDLRAMGMPRVNLLLIGADRIVWNVLETLLMDFDEPIVSWCAGEALRLPPPGTSGTLILHDVSSLSDGDQLRLLRWLDSTMGNTQVISTCPGQLWPRVQAGFFIDTLYYRLNTVCVDVSA